MHNLTKRVNTQKVIFFFSVTPKRDDIIKNCERVFHFMELFFNLMHKETVNG